METTKALDYHTKLVGVTFEGRQEVIATLVGKEKLRLRREADNQYDKNAVAVDVCKKRKWLPIGYIAKDKNTDLANTLDAGGKVNISLSSLTGGDGKSFGVNVQLTYVKQEPVAEPVAEEAKVEEVKKQITRGDIQNVLEHLLVLLNKPSSASSRTLKSELTGVEVQYDDAAHSYTINGKKLMSGSKFHKQFYKEFDKDAALEMVVNAYPAAKGREAELRDMWDINSKASTNWGNAVYHALENYYSHKSIGNITRGIDKKTGQPKVHKALNKNPILKHVVESFIATRPEYEDVMCEPFIASDAFGICGFIDRLLFVDRAKKIVRIQDYKTDNDILEAEYQKTDSIFYKKILNDKGKPDNTRVTMHRLQLSFYAFILEQYGYTVEGTDLFWLNPVKLMSGENPWETFSHEVINLNPYFIGE